MPVLLTNNATARLASSVSTIDTSISLQAGQGALFPLPGAGEWFPLTMVKSTGDLEIVRCTERVNDVLTITRAQEGTSAKTFAADDRVGLRYTSGVFGAVLQKDEDLSDLPDKPAAFANIKQAATETATGVVEKATEAEAKAGTAGKYPDALGVIAALNQFGIGSETPPAIADLNTITKTGSYSFETTATNAPFDQGLVLHQNRDTDNAVQMAFRRSTKSETAVRYKSAGSWSAWNTIYTRESILGSVSQSGGIPSGAIIERGSNANGDFVKYADGTMICTKVIAAWEEAQTASGAIYISSTVTWIFPQAFSHVPVVNANFVAKDSRPVWHISAGGGPTLDRYNGLRFATSVDAGSGDAHLTAIGRWF